MQLIQINDPPSIDIKKTMSTLGEAFEGNQINGDIADDGSDICAKISTNLNDDVSKSVEDITEKNETKEQVESKLNDLNGFIKINGDAQKKNLTSTLDNIDNNKKESENNVVLKNVCEESGNSNGSSSMSEPCNNSASTAANIISTVGENINLEEKYIKIDSNEKMEIEIKNNTSDLKTTNVLMDNKDVASVDSVEISSAVIETQADVCSDQVTDADKLKYIEISIEKKDIIQTISAFSPNSDTNEKEINISAQLQQLEDDASMEEEFNESFIEAQNFTENKSSTLEIEKEDCESNKPLSPVQKQKTKKNDIQSPMEKQDNEYLDNIEDASQKEKDLFESHNQEVNTQTKSASEILTKNPSVTEDKSDDINIDLVKNLESAATEDKPADSSEKSLDVTLSKGIITELYQGIDETTDILDKNEGVSCVAIEKPSEKNDEKHCNKVMDVDAREQVQDQHQKSSNIIDAGVDSYSPAQKYITVKKFTDMTYPVARENNEATKVSEDKKLADKEQELTKVMEVDAIDLLVKPDNNVSLETSDKLPLLQNVIEVKNNNEMSNEETINDTTENSKSVFVGSKAVHESTIDLKNDKINVMEIDDVDEASVVDKSTVDKNVEVNSCEQLTKQDSVINITDNDDEEIKSCTPEYTKAKEDETSHATSIDDNAKNTVIETSQKHSSEVEIIEKNSQAIEENIPEKSVVKQLPVVCKLSNTMDILSDEEDDPLIEKTSEENKNTVNDKTKEEEQNKCINLDDDDDIMFIEDTNSQGPKNEENKSEQPSDNSESQTMKTTESQIYSDTVDNNIDTSKNVLNESLKTNENDNTIPTGMVSPSKEEEPKPVEPTEIIKETKEPLITKSFLKSVTKNLADMTRNELEDFCILKLVESVVDRSNLNEIKTKLKTMAQSVEDLRKKALALTKQNRDLQVVVKTVQEDQKKRNPNPMMPMKITRSVGMQVVLSSGDKSILKKKLSTPVQPPLMTPTKPVRNIQNPKTQKPAGNNIPVPRLVPASSPTVKSPATPVNNAPKPTTIVKTTPQRPEKRPHSRLTSPASSVTVDLTDDEPPAKINTKNPTPPVRLVPSQNLMAPKTRPQFGPTGNSPRKVYIPISTHNQNIRANSAVIKNFVPAPTPRPRQPSVMRMQTVRLNQAPSVNRHPAPLPDAMKQYQPPTWKALPPAPDLKLSKVDNGIVISWKFEGYQPDTYEEVASFQLYAYQETPAPPSTALWKKIGDIKALPLPMACTLTQFMSGFKYYFAVRAIDVRSRIGPFSLPGSIMLISKS